MSIRVKLARSALHRILPGLSPQEPRRGVLAAGSPRGWASGWAACRGRPLSRAAVRAGAVRSIFGQEKKRWPEAPERGRGEPGGFARSQPLPACWRVRGKERLGQPTRSEPQLVPPRLGDAKGLITLNPKLLDIRVVKGWATGSRQLGSVE